MKLLLICWGDPFSTPAGTEIFVGNLALELSRQGHEINLISEARSDKEPSPSNVASVRRHGLRLLGIPYIRALDFRRKCSKHSVELIKESRIDAVIASGAGTFSGYVFGRIKKLRSRPLLIYYAMDSMIMEYERSKASNEAKGLLPSFRRWIWYTTLIKSDKESCLNSDLILASSKDTANHLIADYGISSGKVNVLYEGVPDDFADGIDVIDPDAPIFLHVAGGPRKGTDFFLKAVKLLIEKYDLRVKAVITRATSTHIQQAKSLGVDTEIYKNVTNSKLKRLYASCTALVMPSLSEGFGLPVIEAAMFGKPTIAFRSGSLPELITDGSTGFIVPVGNVDALSQRMYQIWSNNALRRSMCDASKKSCNKFKMSQCSKELVKTLQMGLWGSS